MRFAFLIMTLTLSFTASAKEYLNESTLFRLQSFDNTGRISERCVSAFLAQYWYPDLPECKNAPLIPVERVDSIKTPNARVRNRYVKIKTVDLAGGISVHCYERNASKGADGLYELKPQPQECNLAPLVDISVNGPGNAEDYEMQFGKCYTKSEHALVSTYKCKSGIERDGNPYARRIEGDKCMNGRNEEVEWAGQCAVMSRSSIEQAKLKNNAVSR